ncbi:MAG: hypothetical protein Q7W45_12345 [Bacteroidota bacterium]|nr:hypothetical protein [Bacteroidota bacterium]MDP3146882.1 hypothetical protein [Bacteroidota bacterium]
MNTKKTNHLTLKKAKEQAERHRKQGEERFAKEAVEIQKELKLIETPLSFLDVVIIYRWIFRKQISIEMLSKDILKEFEKTEQYKTFVKRKQEE